MQIFPLIISIPFTIFVARYHSYTMKKTEIINPWEIAFCSMYFGRCSLFEYRELVHGTLKSVARLQGFYYYPPEIPSILAESVDNHIQDGTEVWIEYHYFRSGENPTMPRYMFARLIASLFQQYAPNTGRPLLFDLVGIAHMRSLELYKRALKD